MCRSRAYNAGRREVGPGRAVSDTTQSTSLLRRRLFLGSLGTIRVRDLFPVVLFHPLEMLLHRLGLHGLIARIPRPAAGRQTDAKRRQDEAEDYSGAGST